MGNFYMLFDLKTDITTKWLRCTLQLSGQSEKLKEKISLSLSIDNPFKTKTKKSESRREQHEIHIAQKIQIYIIKNSLRRNLENLHIMNKALKLYTSHK